MSATFGTKIVLEHNGGRASKMAKQFSGAHATLFNLNNIYIYDGGVAVRFRRTL